jgi:phage-related protein
MTIDTALMELKPLYSVGQSKKDHAAFPEDVHDAVGYALHKAQGGDKHPSAKPLKGFSGAGVLEVVEDHAGDTFRAVYTERFEGAIYVLHAFQKKGQKGLATPKQEIELVKRRLAIAEADHARRNKEPTQ